MMEYKCIKIELTAEETQQELNRLAKENWRLICSYALFGNWLILERDIE